MPAKPDFREAAVAASEALLAEHGHDADVSYCFRTEDGAEVLAAAKRRLLTMAGFGIAGIVVGGVIALWLKFGGASSEREEWTKLGIALAFSGTGFALLFIQLRMFRKLVRSHVRARLEAAGEQVDSLAAIPVTLENSATADVGKLLPEDAGMLILTPDDRTARIEGLTHRYHIRAEDTEGVFLAGGQVHHSSPRVRIAYRIGDVTLDISLAPDSTMKQVGYSLSGKAPALFDQVRACLVK